MRGLSRDSAQRSEFSTENSSNKFGARAMMVSPAGYSIPVLSKVEIAKAFILLSTTTEETLGYDAGHSIFTPERAGSIR
jgi:hypothetical protein